MAKAESEKKCLFIAEKPSAMKLVQDAYKNAKNKPYKQMDFFALAGHICKLKEPKEYEKWDVPWAERKLPMVPETFEVGMLEKKKVEELKAKIANGNYDVIIVGTDSDVEGNGIYDLIEEYLGLQNYETKRFFETDMTPKAIMESMNRLTDFHANQRDVGMTEAFRIRSRFDWLVGFNMSTAYSVKANFPMKVGRVKAPTLKLVYDNCKAIDEFVESVAYQPSITTENPEMTARLIDEGGKALAFDRREDAQDVLDALSGTATVESFEAKKKETQPDQLFKLSDVQYEAGKTFGYSPEKTLDLIQSLYEKHKVISYPRTDGRYISSEKAKDFAKLLAPLKKAEGLSDIAKSITAEQVAAVQANKRYVNDEEVKKSSHDALIPTGEAPDFAKMTKDEKNICLMIFRRFLSIFMPPLVEEKTKCVLEDNGNRFACTGSKVISPGFTILYKTPGNAPLPVVKKGDMLKEADASLHEVVSKPPARLTQATLIKAMENIAKYMANGELKDVMKKSGGIGQQSSRASIISDLLKTGYMEERGKGSKQALYITEKGKKYIENLAGSSITSPELTAQWEEYMQEIREGSLSYDEVYAKILDYVNGAIKELDILPIIRMPGGEEIGKCPVCQSPVVKLKKGCRCSKYPDCGFSIWQEVAGKKLSDKNMKDLLDGKETGVINGFKKADGSEFSASLVLKDGKVTWAPSRKDIDAVCPKCGKPMYGFPKGYACTGRDDKSCDFAIWKNICGKELTEKDVQDLVAGKETRVIKGLSKKDGTKFDAALVLKDGKLTWASSRKDIDAVCPKCGKPMYEFPKGYACTGRDDKSCDFAIWKNICGKDLTEKDVQDLVAGKETRLIKGLKKKDGTEFEARLVLKDYKLQWAGSRKDTDMVCPKCGKPIYEFPKGFACTGRDDKSCDFVIWKKQYGKEITEKDIKDLVEGRETRLIKNFEKKNGEVYDARLVMDKEDFSKIRLVFQDIKKKK